MRAQASQQRSGVVCATGTTGQFVNAMRFRCLGGIATGWVAQTGWVKGRFRTIASEVHLFLRGEPDREKSFAASRLERVAVGWGGFSLSAGGDRRNRVAPWWGTPPAMRSLQSVQP